MRVVLDTNVLVSALLFTGTAAEILPLWQKGVITILLSRDVLEEYHPNPGSVSSRQSRLAKSLTRRCTRQREYVSIPTEQMRSLDLSLNNV